MAEEIAIIALLIILNGLFAMAEISIVSAKKSRLEELLRNLQMQNSTFLPATLFDHVVVDADTDFFPHFLSYISPDIRRLMATHQHLPLTTLGQA